jgi:hypothetical protein
MRTAFVAIGVGLSLAAAAAGQFVGSLYGRGPGFRTYGSPSGFGNILFPGTGTAPPLVNPYLRPGPTFAQSLGATVGGHPRSLILGRPDARRTLPVVIPYAVPVWTGYGYAPAPAEYSPVTVVNQPPQQPAVIINQYYSSDVAKPVVRDYTQTELPPPASSSLRSFQAPVPSQPEPAKRDAAAPAPDPKPTIYLIAYKDQSIYPALAYWIEGDTLHYITPQGSHNRASLELIDREFSEQLNRERNVEFSLAP